MIRSFLHTFLYFIASLMISGAGEDLAAVQIPEQIFMVRNLDEARLDGTEPADFYVTNTGNSWGLYYIDEDQNLYVYNENHMEEGIVLAENVVHVACCRYCNYIVFLTKTGDLYGIERGSAPALLEEGVKYALCGDRDILILRADNSVELCSVTIDKDFNWSIDRETVRLPADAVMISGHAESFAALLTDGTVWTWGNNNYEICGIPEVEVVEEPVCVAENVKAIWMGKLQFNNDCLDFKKWKYYHLDRGYCNNLIVMKTDGSLWACGEIVRELDRNLFTAKFFPCEIIRKPYLSYDGINTYQSILAEYEKAWKDETYTLENWKYIDISFDYFVREKEDLLCYSLKDLTDDGTEELIIGFLREGTYHIREIYAYDDGVITCVFENFEREKYVYHQGIVETFWGAGGRDYHTYYQLQENSALKEFQAEVSDIPSNWWTGQPVDQEHLIYYQRLGDTTNDEVEITEEEYININKHYQALPEELEWEALEGFY